MVHGATLAMVLVTERGECAAEAQAPALAAFYERAIAGLGPAVAGAMPVTVASRNDRQWGAQFDCLLVRGWVLLVVGFLLPTILLEYSCTLLAAPHRPGPGFVHSPPVWPLVAVAALGQFAVASVVGWRAVEVALTTCHRWARWAR